MTQKNNSYVLGVDGGATKTVAALADLQGKILKIGKSGSSSPRNVGVEKAAENICQAVKKVLPRGKAKVASVFIGLPAVQERPELVPKVTEELFKERRIAQILRGKTKIASDQVVAFRSGTDKKDGIVLIAGTGAVAHGWKGKREHKSSGWDWLADEGSAFWIGQKYYQAFLKGLDGRGPESPVKKFSKIYSQNFIEEVSRLSTLCDSMARKGDKTAKNILIEAGQELALSVNIIIKKLNFSKTKFPLVLVGSVLKSKIVLKTLKKEIKKAAPKVQFIRPKKEPVIGAIKLAIEYASIS